MMNGVFSERKRMRYAERGKTTFSDFITAKKGKIKGRGINYLCRFILDLCFLNNYLLAVIITALGAKSVRSLEFTAV